MQICKWYGMIEAISLATWMIVLPVPVHKKTKRIHLWLLSTPNEAFLCNHDQRWESCLVIYTWAAWNIFSTFKIDVNYHFNQSGEGGGVQQVKFKLVFIF